MSMFNLTQDVITLGRSCSIKYWFMPDKSWSSALGHRSGTLPVFSHEWLQLSVNLPPCPESKLPSGPFLSDPDNLNCFQKLLQAFNRIKISNGEINTHKGLWCNLNLQNHCKHLQRRNAPCLDILMLPNPVTSSPIWFKMAQNKPVNERFF